MGERVAWKDRANVRKRDRSAVRTAAELEQKWSGKIKDAEGNSNEALQTAKGFEQRVTNAEGNASQAVQTAQGFEDRVSNVEGNYSELKQAVDGLRFEAENTAGKLAQLEITTEGVSGVVKDTSERVNEIEDQKMYRLVIFSSNGNIFKNGNIRTTLFAKVYSWDKNITDTLDSNQFIWTRVSDDAEDDARWNDAHFGGTKSIEITIDDVKVRATFFCDLIDTTTRKSLLA